MLWHYEHGHCRSNSAPPLAAMRPLAQLNDGKPYGRQLKPFNFMLPAMPAHLGIRAALTLNAFT
jgi:hypothetical protein